MKQLVAVLGRGVVPTDTPIATADDLALNRGDGVFDATRVVLDADGARVDHLDRHLQRFARSHELMGMDAPDLDAWEALVHEAVAAWDHPGSSTVKLVSTRGRELAGGDAVQFLTITPYGKSCHPLRVASVSTGRPSDAFADAPWLLGGVKSLSYGVNMAMLREAARRGAEDALMVTTDGYCLEAPRAGLVVAVGDRWVTTPAGGTGILESVTIAVVEEGLAERGVTLERRLLTPAEVLDADGAWLLSSVRGVCPISHLDDVELPMDAARQQLLRELAGF